MLGTNLKNLRTNKTYTVSRSKTPGKEQEVPYSKKDLADELDVSREAVYYWEKGIKTPSLANLLKLCKFLKCTPNDLLNGEY